MGNQTATRRALRRSISPVPACGGRVLEENTGPPKLARAAHTQSGQRAVAAEPEAQS